MTPSATPDPVSPPTAATFAAAVAALVGRTLRPGESLAVAASGGPDSLALLWLASAAFGERVHVLTVDHGLRTEAAGEAASVTAYAASFGVAHTILRWEGEKPAANLQAAARDARYALMRRWCSTNGVAWLATAHHRDDVAETLLMRLARGAGTGGLGGIRPCRDLGDGVTLLRPLLSASKADLAAIVAAAGWVAVDDPSNRAARFDRTHARALLASAPWLDPARLAASAGHLADAEAALVWTVELAWRSRVEVAAQAIAIDATGLPHDLARRLVVRAIAELGSARAPRGVSVERLLCQLAAGCGGTLGGIAVRPARRDGAIWWVARVAEPRRSDGADAAGRR